MLNRQARRRAWQRQNRREARKEARRIRRNAAAARNIDRNPEGIAANDRAEGDEGENANDEGRIAANQPRVFYHCTIFINNFN